MRRWTWPMPFDSGWSESVTPWVRAGFRVASLGYGRLLRIVPGTTRRRVVNLDRGLKREVSWTTVDCVMRSPLVPS